MAMANAKAADGWVAGIRSIFLDADGTILDFDEAERRALVRVLASLGLEPTEGRMAAYHAVNRDLWRRFEAGTLDKGVLQATRFLRYLDAIGVPVPEADEGPRLNARYLEWLAESPLILPGADLFCRRLASRYPLYLATNGISRTQRLRLERSGLSVHFRGVVVSEDAGAPKPHGDFFRHALDRAGVEEPGTVLMVGDMLETDIRGGAAAGLRTAWFNPGGHPVPDGVRVDLVFRSLPDLPDRLGVP
mgnify:CR=1 FL=1